MLSPFNLACHLRPCATLRGRLLAQFAAAQGLACCGPHPPACFAEPSTTRTMAAAVMAALHRGVLQPPAVVSCAWALSRFSAASNAAAPALAAAACCAAERADTLAPHELVVLARALQSARGSPVGASAMLSIGCQVTSGSRADPPAPCARGSSEAVAAAAARFWPAAAASVAARLPRGVDSASLLALLTAADDAGAALPPSLAAARAAFGAERIAPLAPSDFAELLVSFANVRFSLIAPSPTPRCQPLSPTCLPAPHFVHLTPARARAC